MGVKVLQGLAILGCLNFNVVLCNVVITAVSMCTPNLVCTNRRPIAVSP